MHHAWKIWAGVLEVRTAINPLGLVKRIILK